MPSDLELRGVFIPVVTPFAADGTVALDALEVLCRDILRAGAAGIVALGTTGEASALDADEKRTVVSTCARVCSEESRPLIVGAGTNSTAASVAAARALAGTPALAAVLSVVPYYVRPSEAGVVEHFRALALESPVPVVVYNIPYRTGRTMSAGSILSIAAIPGVAGIKQAVGGIDMDTLEILAQGPEGFLVLGGDDAYLFPLALMGGSGAIAASAHVCTERFVAMIDCGLTAKVDEGRSLAEALLPVVRCLFAEPNPSVLKGVLHAQGRIPTPEPRLPITHASSGAVEAAIEAIHAVG
jgi:4-hydroxy-tetrahydrodipicolinate synthase